MKFVSIESDRFVLRSLIRENVSEWYLDWINGKVLSPSINNPISLLLITESLGDGKLVVSKSESKYKSVSGKVVVANRDIETGETKYSKDFPLIKYVTQTGMPMIISTGMTDVEEIQEAIEAAQEGGCEELA